MPYQLTFTVLKAGKGVNQRKSSGTDSNNMTICPFNVNEFTRFFRVLWARHLRKSSRLTGSRITPGLKGRLHLFSAELRHL